MSLLTSEDRLLALDHAMGMIFDGTAWDLSSLSSFVPENFPQDGSGAALSKSRRLTRCFFVCNPRTHIVADDHCF